MNTNSVKNRAVLDVRDPDAKLISNSISSTEMMMRNCPNPTQAELRKLLAIQGFMLQQVGLDMLSDAGRLKNGDHKVNLALKALAASREALKSAAGIELDSDSDSDSDSGSEFS